MNSRVLKVSELLCAVSFSCLQQVTVFYSFNKCFISVTMCTGSTLCQARCCARKALGASMKELPSLRCCLWRLPPKGLPAFAPAFFQAVPCTATTGCSCPPWPTQPQPLPLLPLLLGQLGSWTWSADDSPCSPRVLPPASSPAMTLSRGFCSSSHGLPSVCQVRPFPSISELGVCGFSVGRMRGLLPASPFPLGNCYSFHFSLIQSDHLSGFLLGKMQHKACV